MHIGRRRSLPAPGGPLRRPISLISCAWDVHGPVPHVTTDAHTQGKRCGIGWEFSPRASNCNLQWRRSATLIGCRRREGAGPCVPPSPPVLISEPGPAWIMPVAGTFMRGRHALKPARIGKRRRRTGTADSACRRVFADRDMRPCDRFRPEFPAQRIPDPSRNADASPDCTAPPGIARPQPGGEQGRNCAAVRGLREDRCPQRRPTDSTVFSIQLSEGRRGTAPVVSARSPASPPP